MDGPAAGGDVFNVGTEENEEEDGEFPLNAAYDPNENDLYTFLNVSRKVHMLKRLNFNVELVNSCRYEMGH